MFDIFKKSYARTDVDLIERLIEANQDFSEAEVFNGSKTPLENPKIEITSASKEKMEKMEVSINTYKSSKYDTGRLNIQKSYKHFIGGQFTNSASGHYYILKNHQGLSANIASASALDVDLAFNSALISQKNWSDFSFHDKSKILYRIAEILEDRRSQFQSELIQEGLDEGEALREVECSIDRLVYYAGWGDKYQTIFSSINPVSEAHFNFTVLRPMGVVGIISPIESPLLGLVTSIASCIIGGNSCVVFASPVYPFSAVSFSEILISTDLPAGVVNILCGNASKLLAEIITHRTLNTLVYYGENFEEMKHIHQLASKDMKKIITRSNVDFLNQKKNESPYLILETLDRKTIWYYPN